MSAARAGSATPSPAQYDRVLALLTSPPEVRLPLESAQRRLRGLFARLRSTEDELERAESEDLVWALWCLHPDADAEARMQQLIGAIARDDRSRAGALADALVDDFPDWAEAWNKRATLAYLEGRDADSVEDITRTLELEPRHFGAICGFGQIAERNAEPHAALLAYERAVALNPNLGAIDARARELRARNPRTLH